MITDCVSGWLVHDFSEKYPNPYVDRIRNRNCLYDTSPTHSNAPRAVTFFASQVGALSQARRQADAADWPALLRWWGVSVVGMLVAGVARLGWQLARTPPLRVLRLNKCPPICPLTHIAPGTWGPCSVNSLTEGGGTEQDTCLFKRKDTPENPLP